MTELFPSSRAFSHKFEERLNQLLVVTPIVDTHNDFIWLIRMQLHNQIYKHGFNFNSDNIVSHTSIPKLRKGRVGIQFSSGFVECKAVSYTHLDVYKRQIHRWFNTTTLDTMIIHCITNDVFHLNVILC